MSECNHRCGGRCCSNFVIGTRPERIGELYLAAIERRDHDEPYDTELVMVAEMVIRIDEDDEARARYTCKHFDATAGLCTVYDQRPKMCRDFPYGRVCDYGCGYKNDLPQLVPISTNNTIDERKPERVNA